MKKAASKLSEKLSFYVSPAVFKAIDAAAKAARRTHSDYCRLVIEAALENRSR